MVPQQSGESIVLDCHICRLIVVGCSPMEATDATNGVKDADGTVAHQWPVDGCRATVTTIVRKHESG